MKKITKIALFAAFLALNPAILTAQKNFQTNNQKIWSVNSDVHQYLCQLYELEKMSLPSNAGPWSNAELKMWLYKIDYENLSNSSKILYEKIEKLLNKQPNFILDETLGISVKNTLNPEFYVHTNPDDFYQEKDWIYDFEKRQPLFESDLEFYAANHIYLLMNIPINWASYILNNGSDETPNHLYQPVFMSNVPFLPNKTITDLSVNFPTRAFSSFGQEHWNFAFGRDIVRWGNGLSGNLAVGGNQLYDNYLQFAVFYPKFKYNFLTTFYPHEQNIVSASQNSTMNGLKFFMIHRLEGRFINDRLTASIGEAIMYQSATNTIDLSVFNPMGIFHNYYIRGNANSFMILDSDFALTKGLNLYTQILVDELAAFGEPASTSETPWRPSKMGYLFGTKYQLELPEGILGLYAEGVYADPCLYLREQYNSSNGEQGVSFYGHYREFANGYELSYIRNCIGYKYGGDCISADFKAVYDSLDKLKLNLEFFYLAHGIMYNPLTGDWIVGEGTKAPSTKDIAYDINDSSKEAANASGEVEHLFCATIGGSYDILPQFSVNAAIDNCFIWNKDNTKNNMVFDMQLHFGVKYSFLDN